MKFSTCNCSHTCELELKIRQMRQKQNSFDALSESADHSRITRKMFHEKY